MIRVVLSVYKPGYKRPYADDLSGVPYSVFLTEADAMAAIEKAVSDELRTLNALDDGPEALEQVAIEDSDGNVIDYDYPFRADFDGDHAAIIRFWDGDDYQPVTVYDVYELEANGNGPDSSDNYTYRGFKIHASRRRLSFTVKHGEQVFTRQRSLTSALRAIDHHCLMQAIVERN